VNFGSRQVSAGGTPIAVLTPRRQATVCGTLRSVTLRPRAGVPALEAELYDGSGSLYVVWLGRRHIAGIEPGRRLRISLLCIAFALSLFAGRLVQLQGMEGSRYRALAEQRLAFDELFLIQLGLLVRKRDWQQVHADVAVPLDPALLSRFRNSLSFVLTAAQERVIEDILADLSRPIPMSRLLQGDVGAGKTVVAAAALLHVVAAGKQGLHDAERNYTQQADDE